MSGKNRLWIKNIFGSQIQQYHDVMPHLTMWMKLFLSKHLTFFLSSVYYGYANATEPNNKNPNLNKGGDIMWNETKKIFEENEYTFLDMIEEKLKSDSIPVFWDGVRDLENLKNCGKKTRNYIIKRAIEKRLFVFPTDESQASVGSEVTDI
jgi:hypothetical protein